MRFLPFVLLGCSQDYGVSRQHAHLAVDPIFHDAGLVPVGASTTFEVELFATNGRVRVLSVDLLPVEGEGFSAADGDLPTIEEDGSATLSFTYSPLDEGYDWAAVTVVTDENEGSRHAIEVRGQGVLASVRALSTLLDFGPTEVGRVSKRDLVLVNDGQVDVSLERLEFDDSRFDSNQALPAILPAGEQVSVSLAFAPTDTSEVFGSVTPGFDSVIDLGAVSLQGNACSVGSGDLYDSDDDGYSWCSADCDDSDADVHPGAKETCNGTDDDCDGEVDEGTSCYDDDGDGYTEDDGDCNDGEPDVNPGESEVPDNGIDDDCDGTVDAGALDADGDGYSVEGGDCDDADASVYPGGPEQADGIDNDCDGTVDEGTDAYDDDGDGASEDGGDCDDTDASVYPGATEDEDWIDNDCDGTVDEGTNNYDDDGDGFTENGGDCNDANASINPGAEEVQHDGKDNDCDGVTE